VRRVGLVIGAVVVLLLAGLGVWRLVGTDTDPLEDARAAVGTQKGGRVLAQLRRDQPQSAEIHYLSARHARLEGPQEYQTAAQFLDKAASLGWPASEVEKERTILAAATNPARGKAALNNLLAATPRDVDVLLALAELELQTGQKEKAADLADRALRVSPNDARALHLRGTARHQGRRLDLAREDLEAAVSAAPDSVEFPKARLTLGICLLDLGDFGRARELFLAARADDPDNALAVFGVGRTSAYLGQFDEAEQAFQAVLAKRPGHVETLVSLAQVVEQKGDLSRAAEYLEQAATAEPDRLETHARLAKLLAALGRTKQAAYHEARFRELDPTRKPTSPGPNPKGDR
jgi:tetratricopeptide (TPR) repeat protein